MMLAYLKMAFEDIMHRKKRSFLTIIGIMIGIVAVVSLVSIGQGLQASIEEQFKQIGSDLIMIMPGSGGSFAGLGPSGTQKLTQHDIDVVKGTRGVDLVGGLVAKYAKVEFQKETKYTFVIGLPTDESQNIILNMQQVVVEAGQEKFREDDMYKAVIGYGLAHDNFFRNNVGLRDKIIINGEEFRVVTIIESLGNPSDDAQIYIPIKAAEKIFNESDNYYSIIVSVEPGFEPDAVAENIKKRMREDRGLERGDEDFSVQTYTQLLETVNSVIGIVQVVLLGIAAISLLVGGIGIMNTMYTSVLERTNEIGVMKAIGARNSDVLMIFLLQAGILGLLGGAVGCAFGVIVAKTIQAFAQSMGFGFLKIYLNPELIIGMLVFSFMFGIISGLLPSLRALKMKVVDALRYE